MLRHPAVAGLFYPSHPRELSSLIEKFTLVQNLEKKAAVRACLVPHAGYVYSGAVAGAVFARILLRKKILLLGVRHYPNGEPLAILSEGAWRTPLGDVPIDMALAKELKVQCPLLREDPVAHAREHSLEVELPFLQALVPEFSFVPVAVGTHDFETLRETGEGIARVLAQSEEEILVVTSSDLNHYQEDQTTRKKDAKAIEHLEKADARGLFEICCAEKISMCGMGAAVVMLTAMKRLGVMKGELVRYATSGDVSGDYSAVVGYAGMVFS